MHILRSDDPPCLVGTAKCLYIPRQMRRTLVTQDRQHDVRAPGILVSRWREEAAPWEPLRTELVVEVAYDQVTGDRFRHGTGFVRWRPDKAPGQCDFDQLAPPLRPAELDALISSR